MPSVEKKKKFGKQTNNGYLNNNNFGSDYNPTSYRYTYIIRMYLP